MLIEGKEVIVTGKHLKVAHLKNEWYEDIGDPEVFVNYLKSNKVKADIFTFWQRLPQSRPMYKYQLDWISIAALPIKNYDYWFTNVIDCKERNLVRKAEKKGVELKKNEFNDDFINGVVEIFNESPIRQGRPFMHYGMDANAVRKFFTPSIYQEDIVGAYSGNELIGFITIAYTNNYAMLTQILSKFAHRDKSPNNALIAKAVEICTEKKIPHLAYAFWARGLIADFKKNNGFERILLPHYFIPLNAWGTFILKMSLQGGINSILPEKLVLHLMSIREQWYKFKYPQYKEF